MELRYPLLAIGGLIISLVFLALFILYRVKGKKTIKGIRLANADLLYNDKYYKINLIIFYALKIILIVAVVISLTASFVLLSKPYYEKKIKKQQYNRDIMICLDISSSVNDLNLKLVKELENTVRNLSGERVGIVIFNTSPVLLSPLSDDYEYTIEQLENIRKAIKEMSSIGISASTDWLSLNNFLYGGTIVGNETRGSSLIGDGLMGGLINFPGDSQDRTKIMIFATDNDKNGDGYLTLQEAADYCTKAGVTVYGIGTKLMYTTDADEMKAAVESTGGKFYLEEDGEAFKDIVTEIEAKSASLVEGKTIVKEIEKPEKTFRYLYISVLLLIVVSIILRRGNLWFYAGSALMMASLVLTFIFGVLPAHKYSMGPDFEVKKNSDYRVLFVIDDTISMVANDGKDGMERLDQLKLDCEAIIDELEGARFGVISFNNDASVRMPFNNNAAHAKNVVNSLYPLESYYAKGTNPSTPVEAIKEMIGDTNQGKVAVFYLSDGEITNEEAEQVSFSSLASYIDSGAVLGYGTTEGGTMQIKSIYDDSYTQIMDYSSYPFEEAVSRIDEKNLNKIAKEMNVSYINMNDGSKINSLLSKIKSNMDMTEEVIKEDDEENFIKAPVNHGYLWIIPGIILMLVNSVYIIKRD